MLQPQILSNKAKENIQMNDEINVRRIEKTQLGVPGSSPEFRTGVNEVQYRQNAGKAPLLEKRNSKYNGGLCYQPGPSAGMEHLNAKPDEQGQVQSFEEEFKNIHPSNQIQKRQASAMRANRYA